MTTTEQLVKEINSKQKPELMDSFKKNKVEISRYKKIVSFVGKGKLLDVGCGSGYLTNFLNKDVKYYGVDSDKRKINYARKIHKNHKFIYSLGEKIPFGDRTFDYVIISEVIEHVESPLRLLRECKRVLKNGGRIIGSTPNATDFMRIIKAMMRRDHGVTDHLSVFGSFEMKLVLHYTGFKNIKVIFTPFCLNIFKLKIRIGSSFLSWLFPNLGEELIFVGDKNKAQCENSR